MEPLEIVFSFVAISLAAWGGWWGWRSYRLDKQESDARIERELDDGLPAPLVAEPKNWPKIIKPGIGLDRNVFGREKDAERLRETLTQTSVVAVTPGTSGGAVVKGRGGLGKTTLARYYIAKYRAKYHGIWWLRAQTTQTLAQDLADLAATLGVGDAESPPEQRAKAVLVHLQTQADPWLLVCDNAERFSDIEDFLPEGESVHVLLTSREGDWPKLFTEQAAVALSPKDSVALLRQESERPELPPEAYEERDDREQNPNIGNAPADANAMVKALDFLPLAIVMAGSSLRRTPSESFDGYREKLAERIKDKPKGDVRYPDSVFGAVKLSLDKLSDDAALLMKVFCWLSPDDLWPGLVTALADKESIENEVWKEILAPIPDALWALARDASRVDQAVADLRDRSLLDYDEDDSWHLHRLTQEVQRSLLTDVYMGSAVASVPGPRGQAERGPGSSPGPSQDETKSRREFAEASAAFVFDDQPGWSAVAAAMVAAGYPFDSDFRENWPICTRLNPHVAALMRDPPATAAMDYLLNQASIYLDVQRQDDLALSYSQKALELKIARLGEANEILGTAYTNLSGRYWRLGRLKEAERHAARAVEIAEILENCDEAQSAIWLSNHGLTADDLSRTLEDTAREETLALAQQRYDQGLELDQRLHGRESAEVATSLTNLADLWAWQGLWTKALEALGEALSTRRKGLEAGDPLLAQGLSNLGSFLLQSGRVRVEGSGERALDLLEQALVIYEDAFADLPRHPDRVRTSEWLTSAHWSFEALGEDGADLARAEALCRAYDLDPNDRKQLGLDFAARAVAWRERGEEPLGDMQILDAQRAAEVSQKDGPGADSTA